MFLFLKIINVKKFCCIYKCVNKNVLYKYVGFKNSVSFKFIWWLLVRLMQTYLCKISCKNLTKCKLEYKTYKL